MSRTILLAGGGTGGHVFPSLAVAGALARAGARVAFVGTASGLESRLVPEAGWPLHEIEMIPLARRLSPALVRVPVVLLRSAAAVARLLRSQDVAAAAVFGGYVSLPLAVAAWRTGTPYVVHEQNAVPGLANRLAVRRAAAVAATFPSSVGRFGRGVRAEVTGNPVRPGLGEADREVALRTFGLQEGRRTLLVFGGSQGARRINEALVDALGRWSAPDALQILHVTGHANFRAVDRAWAEALEAVAGPVPLVRRVDFVDRMELAYAAADVAVCRSGASTIAELSVLGVPSVLVPYPHATADHQRANAQDLAAAGGAVVVDDAVLDGAALVAAAEPLLTNDVRRERVAAAARAFATPDAADRVAALILRAAGLPAPVPTPESSR